jgi:hypothetical protein
MVDTMLLPLLRMAMLLLVAGIIPQVLGAIVLSRASRGWFRTFAGILVPAVTFFLISATFFRTQAAQMRSEGVYVCGMFGAMAFITTFGGSLVHLVISALWVGSEAVLRRLRPEQRAGDAA